MNQPASSQKPVHSGHDSPSGHDAAERPTGLDQASLRQAIHDLRGSLNTMSVQLDVALTRIREGDRDDGSFGAQLAMFGAEIRRLDRMLRQLAEAGASLAERVEPVDLRVLLTEVFAETRTLARSVTMSLELPPEGDLAVLARAANLRRALSIAARRSVEAMPDGGAISIAVAPSQHRLRIEWLAKGPSLRVELGRKPLGLDAASEPGAGWFHVQALVLGMGGAFEFESTTAGLRAAIDLPLPSTPRKETTCSTS